MNKIMSMRRGKIRGQLLTTVSTLALTVSIYSIGEAQAGDADRPPIWIELGGQFEQLSDGQQPFDPPFVQKIPPYLPSPLVAQKPPATGLDWETKVSFEPKGSDWVFTAAVRYGRNADDRHGHQQTSPNPVQIGTLSLKPPPRYIDTQTSSSEAHVIIDFMVGKDVGLGMFGGRGASVLSGGVRVAQLASRSAVNILTAPNVTPLDLSTFAPKYHYSYSGSAWDNSSFRGIGPAIFWDASAPVDGNEQDGEIAVDWGANAAVLFGRQKASGKHQSARAYHCTILCLATYAHYYTRHQYPTAAHVRARMVTVPNFGAFAGLSFRFTSVKISVGYRGDFFFGAMDGGLDTHKSYNQEFYGPFASVSIGIGG